MSRNTIGVFLLRSIVVCILLSGFLGCTNQQNINVVTLHEGSFTIKAELVNNKRNGKTEIYDSLGKLASVQNYKDDFMSGLCINYFPSGVVSDSVHYEYDKPQRYWKHYDQDGRLKYITYFYFGLKYGPDLWYRKDRVLERFRFYDFDGNIIVESSYNNHGHIDSITKMALPIVLNKRKKMEFLWFNFSPICRKYLSLNIPTSSVFLIIKISSRNCPTFREVISL